MSEDLTKKAVEMLLKGATLLGVPCPYCKGVRVMKDGTALCVNCGRKPDNKVEDLKIPTNNSTGDSPSYLRVLEKKLENLSEDLDKEKAHKKQQAILQSINSLVEIINKLKK